MTTLEEWLTRCEEIARSGIDGIETPSRQLADFAEGDRLMMEQARRTLLTRQQEHPEDPIVRQMLSLWRRAFEKGNWDWTE